MLSLWALLVCVSAHAAEPPIRYALDLRKPSSHRVVVTMSIPDARPATTIQLPAWSNLYQMRDFVRNVRLLKARCDGVPLKLERLDRNTWRSGGQACSSLELRYAVRANEESPYSSALNSRHAFLNLGLLLFYLPQERARSARVKFLLPAGWKLATLLDEEAGEFQAANYDELVDSPVEAGNFREYDYTERLSSSGAGHSPAPYGTGQSNERGEGQGSVESPSAQGEATYRVVIDSDAAAYPREQLLAAIKKITETETALMGEAPFRRYTFILHFQRHGAAGGMEHLYGAAISMPAADLTGHWDELEATLAHEFFHAWNVKRIRPQGLEPVDYIRGNDTRDLWFSEGVTSCYQELVLLRAGLVTRQVFYDRLAQEIDRLEERPARRSQSVEQSGREAWLEKYRRYNRPDRSISYYNKGALLGFLLDLGIRHASRDQHSLDDLMRRLNQDYAHRGRFFTEQDLRNLVAELAPEFRGCDAFFRDYVSGTRELDYDTYLGFAGLKLLSESGGGKYRVAYRIVEIPNPTPEQLRVREGWLEGKTDQ